MTLDQWNGAVRPKVHASWNLHYALLGQPLDFFILLSSTTGLVGNLEQSNYASGNTFQDALARYRLSQGLPAVSLNLPVVMDVGFVAEKPELLEAMRSTGWTVLEQNELHAVLDYHCRPQFATDGQGSSVLPLLLSRAQVAPRHGLFTQVSGSDVAPSWQSDPLFRSLVAAQSRYKKSGGGGSGGRSAKSVKFAAVLAAATSLAEAEAATLDALLGKLSQVLCIELANLDPGQPMLAYGVDSLVAVEIRSWLLKELGAELSVFEMTSQGSIQLLAAAAAAKSRFLPKFEGGGE
jgi:hypothetical protein